MRGWLGIVLLVLCVGVGCTDPPGGQLLVEVRTGLVPGPEFRTVETVLLRTNVGEGASEHVGSASAQARFGQDYRTGHRVAEFPDMVPGVYAVRVSLIRPDGRSVLVTRTVVLALDATVRVLRVVMDRNCVGVECPVPGGSPALSECLGGRCVDPRCEPPDPAFCGELFCNDVSECPAGPSCSEPACLDGVCEQVARVEGPDACPEGTWCSVDAGACLPLEEVADAGADGSAACGTVCTGGAGPCEVGYWDCSSGSPVCSSFLLRPVGTECGGGRVCDARGECVTCPEGAACREGCEEGTVDCSTGAIRCATGAAASTGASCDPSAVLLAGLDDAASVYACSLAGTCERRESLGVSPSPAALREGAGPLTLTLRASVPVSAATTVTIGLSGPSHLQLVDGAGAAVATLDVTLGRGEITAPFALRANDDGMASSSRAFTVLVGPASSTDPRFDGLDPADVPGLVHDACDADRGDCNGVLADGCETALTSPETCGMCTRACLLDPPNAAPTCGAGGSCDIVCDAGFADCDGNALNGCEASLGAATSCGSCTVSCGGATPVCLSSGAAPACVADCRPPQTLCSPTVCADTLTDESHCGDCTTVCPGGDHAGPLCTAGGCGLDCDPGFDDCDASDANGCEASLRTTSDCGSCGTSCELAHSFETCASGSCEVASCEPGWADCDGVATNGCERALGTLTDCAACDDACPAAAPSATGSACTAGACALSCVPGRADCNGAVADGCEADLSSDETCGSCATRCFGGVTAGSDRCVGGSCSLSCDPGTASCNMMSGDGCEVTLGTPGHCTACGDVCPFPNASGVCAAGPTCTLGACNAGYSDCNTIPDDGCELPLSGGACTPIGQLCNNGTLSCSGARARPVCNPGGLLPAGSSCGSGGTCDASGNCLCMAGTPANTPCGTDSVCNGGTPNRCVRSAFWEAPGCSATPTGNSLCVGRGFARAISAYGYSWSECGGPNAAIGAVDNCLEYDAARARCTRWTPGSACNGVSLGSVRFGVALNEYGGDPTHVFRITDFWGRGCPGWNPGYSIRTVCEF